MRNQRSLRQPKSLGDKEITTSSTMNMMGNQWQTQSKNLEISNQLHWRDHHPKQK